MKRASEQAKRTKSSLVRTRNVIVDKFRKLYDERLDEESRLRQKYAPITDSLHKLINMKERTISMGNGLADVYDGDDPSENMEMETYQDNQLDSDVALNAIEGSFRAQDSENRDDLKKMTRKLKNVDELRQSERKKAANERKLKRSIVNDSLRENSERGESNEVTKRKYMSISPEDYDLDGTFIGLSPKRRKLSKISKRKYMSISEDYDLDGTFIGHSPKRRKVKITPRHVTPESMSIISKSKKRTSKIDDKESKRVRDSKVRRVRRTLINDSLRDIDISDPIETSARGTKRVTSEIPSNNIESKRKKTLRDVDLIRGSENEGADRKNKSNLKHKVSISPEDYDLMGNFVVGKLNFHFEICQIRI